MDVSKFSTNSNDVWFCGDFTGDLSTSIALRPILKISLSSSLEKEVAVGVKQVLNRSEGAAEFTLSARWCKIKSADFRREVSSTIFGSVALVADGDLRWIKSK